MKGSDIYERRLTSREIAKLDERLRKLEAREIVAWRWCHRKEIEPRIWHYSETPVEATELVMVEALTVSRQRF